VRAALRVEMLKLTRSPVGVLATLAVVAGTVLLLGGTSTALAAGNPELTAKLGPGATLDWPGLLRSATQVTAAGGLLGSGVVLAWLFGREVTDGTVGALFALPVGRARIALAKLAVHAAWVVSVQLLLAPALLGLGLLLGHGPPTADTWTGLGRQLALGVLTGLSATPVGWVTTLGRSLLAGTGCAVGLVVVGQVAALTGAGGWVPFAAPALWAFGHGTSTVQLGPTVLVAAAAAAATCLTWARLELDR